ncbi:MAG TPA: tetratricopeptide repeat protein [Syntrophales bacterium]|jgi:tetratricopeptide (TPR) repeat protein|nr:tetratricopeptide repeat protein [Syntrophales bacterium]HON24205.1 tetratricopeptide repeat protein [Syntrophales bacterium]HOU77228.1 tetratricopeptide repeat protein [Syntrophales bacterium]HPC32887.1 tetratricopeptide repeat protein [Syntrophales bacterium]HQG33385.1 tetratricopeptide repeat protein [Syntrophales bacterium]
MRKVKAFLPASVFLVVLLSIFLPGPAGVFAASGGTAPDLEEGIRQYQAENYEEAIEILGKYRRRDPASSLAAFFLGMAYKQANDVPAAEGHLRDAATLPPPVKQAPVELIDVLYQQGKLEEARQWIAVAEGNNLFPAKVAFLKGMIAAAEGRYQQAVEAFDQAKKLDAAYTQSADLQIGVCYMNMRKYDLAKQRFQTAITQDPLSDLGSFARRYQDLVEERSFLERPLRITIGLMAQYDNNILSEPTWNGFWYQRTGTDFWERDEKSFKYLTTARLDYVPILTGPFTFNASYAAAASFQEKYSTSYDLVANTISANPGFNFGRFMMVLAGNYTQVMKRNPSYQRYSENYTVGPLLRYMPAPNHVLEVSAGYAGKNYFEAVAQPQLWDQSSRGLDSYLSWYWMFGNSGGLLNLRYGFSTESANGAYFDNRGHRFTANFMTPKYWKIRAQLGGEMFLQEYQNPNATFDNVKRSDQTYTLTAGLYWDINRYLTIIAPQYMKTRVFSNIFLYDYDRDVYSVGLELRF